MIFTPLTYFSPGFNLLKSCLEKFGICGPDTVMLLVEYEAYLASKPPDLAAEDGLVAGELA